MLYTLMVTLVLHSSYYRQSSSVTTTSVPFFNSLEACEEAGRNYPMPSSGKEKFVPQKVWHCAPMGVQK